MQMPALELIGAEAKLVWEEPDDEEVALARDSYAALRHHLRSLQGEVRSPLILRIRWVGACPPWRYLGSACGHARDRATQWDREMGGLRKALHDI